MQKVSFVLYHCKIIIFKICQYPIYDTCNQSLSTSIYEKKITYMDKRKDKIITTISSLLDWNTINISVNSYLSVKYNQILQ